MSASSLSQLVPYAARCRSAALVHTSNLAEEVISVSWLSSCAVIETFDVAVFVVSAGTFRNVADKARLFMRQAEASAEGWRLALVLRTACYDLWRSQHLRAGAVAQSWGARKGADALRAFILSFRFLFLFSLTQLPTPPTPISNL
ncbi:MAG: hypothetical protein ACKERG_03290 [Candidatus Hodgkinia cicadicola]